MDSVTRKPIIYLTNKELLAEIHRCKNSFCEFVNPQFADFHTIVSSRDEITVELIKATCADQSKLRTPKVKRGQTPQPVEVKPTDLVIRVMTCEHIPVDPHRDNRKRTTDSGLAVTNFPPFKHYKLDDDGALVEVGRSHWKGDFETGSFAPHRGRVTSRMARMWMMLIDRYARRANWRGYSYNDEMRSLAITHLCQVGLQFNEAKSSNPFAFYTTTITHCFTRVLNLEKREQALRDDILFACGAAPSIGRQIEHDMAVMGLKEPPKLAAKRGRKPKALAA